MPVPVLASFKSYCRGWGRSHHHEQHDFIISKNKNKDLNFKNAAAIFLFTRGQLHRHSC